MKFQVVRLEVRVDKNQCDCFENALRSILHLNRGTRGDSRLQKKDDGTFILVDLSPSELKKIQEVMESLAGAFLLTKLAGRGDALAYWGGYRHLMTDKCQSPASVL